jgi:hypothetical protein
MTYTYTVDLDLERGEHELSVQVNNVWQIVSSNPITVTASYDLASHGVELYQGDGISNCGTLLFPTFPSSRSIARTPSMGE